MSTQELIDRLNELGEWAFANEWEVPIDLGITCYKAAAVIEVLRDEIKCLLENR